MKPLFKFLNVLIAVVAIVAIGLTASDLEKIFAPNDANPVIATVSESPKSEEPLAFSGETELEETESQPTSPSELPHFNYEMETIDPHSIDHLYAMINIVENYLTNPDGDYETLHRNLYSQNYLHLEEELNQKNEEIDVYLVKQLSYLKSRSDQIDTTVLVTNLANMLEVLSNLVRVA